MRRKNDKSPTTHQLLQMIKKTDSFAELSSKYLEHYPKPDLSLFLYELMDEKKKAAKDVILASGIERSYYYHILSGQKKPGRNIVLRIGFSLKVNLEDMNHLLCLAGHNALYPRLRRDAAIIYSIENGFSMEETNHFLIELEEAPLYQEKSN